LRTNPDVIGDLDEGTDEEIIEVEGLDSLEFVLEILATGQVKIDVVKFEPHGPEPPHVPGKLPCGVGRTLE